MSSAEHVRAFRLAYRIPLADLARALGTTKQYVSDIELGIRPMSDTMRIRLFVGFEKVMSEREERHKKMRGALFALKNHLLDEEREKP